MRRVTMKDIGKRAGVSQAAVSKILNSEDPMVGEETRKRVLRIAEELGYRPNYYARLLRKGKTDCIGLIGNLRIIDPAVYLFSKVSQGVESEMADSQSPYSLIIFGAHYGETYQRSLQLIENGIVDGLIWIILATAIEEFEEKVHPWMRQHNIPFVVIHSLSRDLPFDNVGMDSRKGGYLATEHLLKLGHRRIAFYRAHESSPQYAEMLAGYRQAFEDAGVAPDERLILRPSGAAVARAGEGGMFAAAHEMGMAMDGAERPTAVFAPEDEYAYGFIKAFRERGLRVPEDIAVVGFDDEVPARYFETDLTTVHHPFEEKGREAVRMLTGVLQGRLDGNAVHRKIIQPTLTIRGSCGWKRRKENGT